MNIERLKELKQQVFDDFQLYEVKMQNSFEESMKEVTPTGEMDEAGNDLTSLIDAEIARQSVREMAVCPNCNGSGVYQEYDEYDRYHVHACYKCEGTGEIARQSVTSEEV